MCARLGGVRPTSVQLSVSESQLHRWIRGQNSPPAVAIFRLAQLSGARLRWVAWGEGPMLAEPSADPDAADTTSDEMIDLPSLEECTSTGIQGNFLAMRRRWILEQLHVEPETLRHLLMQGDSMEPTLLAGEVLLVARHSGPGLNRDGIYVVRINGALRIKRLQQMEGGRMRVSSDNAAYTDFSVTPGGPDQVEILGRVVCAVRPQ